MLQKSPLLCAILNVCVSVFLIYNCIFGEEKKKRSKEKKEDIVSLINVFDINDHALITTSKQEICYFFVKAENLSVLSQETISAKIYALVTVLKGIAELELMCLNSKENIEANKKYLEQRKQLENNPVIRKLLAQDQQQLDQIQVEMATAREFLIMVRFWNPNESLQQIKNIERTLIEQGFEATLADSNMVKRILAVYFEQDITNETYDI